MVTHDEEAGAVASRVIRIRDGRVDSEELKRGRHAAAVSSP
jgi:ABC-type lipoprotein export system ATPase subunit